MLTKTISFPNLGIEVNPPTSVDLGFMDIHWYGIIIAVGFVLAVVYALKRSKQFGLKEDNILDLLLAAVPLSIICARAYYCIFYWELYADDPVSVFYIWKGGIAIYGAIIGAVGALLLIYKWRKIPLLPMMDVGGLGLMIGQMIGRWGNFINREAYGAETDSFLKMGLMSEDGIVTYYHPTFFYESMWNLVGFIVLHFYSKRRKFDGEIFALYVAWYGLGRAWIEGLRTDSLWFFGTGLRVSQVLAILSAIAAIGIIAYVYMKKNPDPSKLHVNCLKTEQEET